MKSDSNLQRDVIEEFKCDPKVDHAHIGVTATSGVVTLSGLSLGEVMRSS